jgi:HSP20 family protein
MAGLLTRTKKEQEERPAPTTGTLVPYRDFPFFLSRLRDEFDQLLDRFARGWPSLWPGDDWRWDVAVQDQDDAVVVRAEAPGFEPGDFDLQVRGNQLVLRAAKKTEKEEKERGYREEQRRECYQAMTLPPGIDTDKVTAKYHNGVLTVSLPKTAAGKGRRIPIKGS